MTAQLSECLIYKGQALRLCSEPLESHFAINLPRPEFHAHASCCWRGYIGTWEIEGGRLYLIGIENWTLEKVNGSYTSVTCLPTLSDGTEVTIASLFPESDGARIFADWYTGELRCPQGERLTYVHGGFDSKYERDLLIHVERGVVVSEQVRENTEDIRLEEEVRRRMAENPITEIPAFLRKM
jgi:hypothetical protein